MERVRGTGDWELGKIFSNGGSNDGYYRSDNLRHKQDLNRQVSSIVDYLPAIDALVS